MPLKEVPENTIANSLKSECIKLPNQELIKLDLKRVEQLNHRLNTLTRYKPLMERVISPSLKKKKKKSN